MARSTTTDVDAQIGATIRTLRIGQRMTQAELAREIGVTFQQVQKYERGVNRVSAATMLKLAETFDSVKTLHIAAHMRPSHTQTTLLSMF